MNTILCLKKILITDWDIIKIFVFFLYRQIQFSIELVVGIREIKVGDCKTCSE